MKKMISLVMILALTVCMAVPGPWLEENEAFAAESEKDTIDEIAEQFGDPSNVPFDYTRRSDRRKALKLAADLPEKYDLRNVDGVSYVTPVKFKNPFGNCWGYAAIAAAETSILGDDELRGDFVADVRKTDDSSKVQMDLSEKQLTYFARTPINDPDNPQNGEGDSPILLDPDEDPVAAAYNEGGFAPTATTMFAAGVGPVLESENPLFRYQGKEGMKQKEWVDEDFKEYEYSESDDWALDEEYRFSNSFSLRESFVVPSPAKVDDSGQESVYEYNPEGVAAIKEQLYEKRGVQIGYQDDTFNAAFTDHGDYINSNFAHYTFCPEGPRHAVCIVGWDDTYPAENFRHELDPNDEGYTEEDTVPPGNGAWLVKNSWGSGEEEFPNRGDGTWGIEENGKHTGYFWLSYYDQSIATPEALDFESNKESDAGYTDVTDQHDLLPIKKYLTAHVDSEMSTANIFKASVCEELKKVSCETVYPNTEVTFKVYLLANNYESPVDGLLMDTVTETFAYGGFHKVPLNKPFTIMKGQSYAIVVSQKVPAESGTSYAVGVKVGLGKAVINKGESLILADGSWQDLSDKKLQKKLVEYTVKKDGADKIDNFPIKGYAEKKPDIVLEVKYSGFLSLPIPGEEEEPLAYFKAWYTDNTGSDDPIKVVPEWKVLEGGDGVVELMDGRDPSRKTVRCKKLGRDYIVITADGIGQVVHSIKVQPSYASLAGIKTGKDSITLNIEYEMQEGLSGFEVEYRAKGTKTWQKKEFGLDSSMLRITGLKAGKKYEVKVRSFAESAYGRLYGYQGTGLSGKVGLKNTLKAKGKTVKVNASALMKGRVTVSGKKAFSVKNAKGKVTYAKKSGVKKISVNKKTGNLNIMKGLGKGTYKVKVTVKAAGKGAYLPASKTVTVTVKVK